MREGEEEERRSIGRGEEVDMKRRWRGRGGER